MKWCTDEPHTAMTDCSYISVWALSSVIHVDSHNYDHDDDKKIIIVDW